MLYLLETYCILSNMMNLNVSFIVMLYIQMHIAIDGVVSLTW